MSCQVQRAFFPTGLPMVAMARALWDRRSNFDAVAGDYFRTAFGADGLAAHAYCQELTRLFDPPYLRGEKPRHDEAVAAAYARVPAAVSQFRPVIRRNLDAADLCQARSWRYLDRHADVCLGLAEALRHRALGDDVAAQRAWDGVKRLVQERETDLQSVLDVYEFTKVVGAIFRPPEGG